MLNLRTWEFSDIDGYYYKVDYCTPNAEYNSCWWVLLILWFKSYCCLLNLKAICCLVIFFILAPAQSRETKSKPHVCTGVALKKSFYLTSNLAPQKKNKFFSDWATIHWFFLIEKNTTFYDTQFLSASIPILKKWCLFAHVKYS